MQKQIRHIVRGVIKEAMDDIFSFSELRLLSFNDRVRYCLRHLGDELAHGSSRIVFQIDDYKVLKLAKNKAGVEQNKVELNNSSPATTMVYKNLSDTQDYYFIVVEYAIPLIPKDMKKLTGLTFDEFSKYISKLEYMLSSNNPIVKNEEENKLSKIEKKDRSGTIRRFRDHIDKLNITEIYDFGAYQNLGLVMRDGKAEIVFIDNGMDDNVNRNFYYTYDLQDFNKDNDENEPSGYMGYKTRN